MCVPSIPSAHGRPCPLQNATAGRHTVRPSQLLRRHNSCIDFSFSTQRANSNSPNLKRLNAVFELVADRKTGGIAETKLLRLLPEGKFDTKAAFLSFRNAKDIKIRLLNNGTPAKKKKKVAHQILPRILSRGVFLATFQHERTAFSNVLLINDKLRSQRYKKASKERKKKREMGRSKSLEASFAPITPPERNILPSLHVPVVRVVTPDNSLAKAQIRKKRSHSSPDVSLNASQPTSVDVDLFLSKPRASHRKRRSPSVIARRESPKQQSVADSFQDKSRKRSSRRSKGDYRKGSKRKKEPAAKLGGKKESVRTSASRSLFASQIRQTGALNRTDFFSSSFRTNKMTIEERRKTLVRSNASRNLLADGGIQISRTDKVERFSLHPQQAETPGIRRSPSKVGTHVEKKNRQSSNGQSNSGVAPEKCSFFSFIARLLAKIFRRTSGGDIITGAETH